MSTPRPTTINENNYNDDVVTSSAAASSTTKISSALMRKADDIPPQNRRFDSLAVLIQGDQRCGAACFDGENILLANNGNLETSLYLAVMEYITHVAELSYAAKQDCLSKNDPLLFKMKRAELLDQCNSLKDDVKNTATEETYIYMNENRDKKSVSIYREKFNKALDKITTSIIDGYLFPSEKHTFDVEPLEAIYQTNIRFLKSKTDGNIDVHAELKIIDELLMRDQPPNEIYIGISIRCCEKCEKVINAVKASGLFNIFETRTEEGHGHDYPAAYPSFLTEDRYFEIKKRFMLSMGAKNFDDKTLDEIFNPKKRIDNSKRPKKPQDHEQSTSLEAKHDTSWDNKNSPLTKRGIYSQRDRSHKQDKNNKSKKKSYK